MSLFKPGGLFGSGGFFDDAIDAVAGLPERVTEIRDDIRDRFITGSRQPQAQQSANVSALPMFSLQSVPPMVWILLSVAVVWYFGFKGK
jgi:hypothetical protein